ncbi:type VI secretion system-associated FHA domain protein [Marinobacterium aestuariivivens]|uniref:Type VI secretion system-associated FHA domain protein n=1 Tax=Marinobacterium aestuariivivens TaxID=1698799 RepID=A0ABW1ZZN8_9GAMM
MDCLQRTLDRFLDELSPVHLEEAFSDFCSGWGSRDKKYWRLYRKQFNRKLDRREFHHRFTALFVEELRGKG